MAMFMPTQQNTYKVLYKIILKIFIIRASVLHSNQIHVAVSDLLHGS